ncbi:hypothetical protein GW835_02485 [archaeon]|jgi:hypothetical protein|nr:hypothetical protein [archaeon]NCP79412.1 hypothetical protein [archaeon]NCP97355.1 hypothetical protein [archaeon]NCQ07179.1 hypothetical protein [archaeon]NCQ50975.1 hypothetical protein [archaeon]
MSNIFLNFLNDFDLILQLFLILTIIAFIRRRVTHNTLALFLISVTVIAMIFLFWPVFKIGYIFYILLSVGVAGIFVDFFFISAGGSAEEMMGKKMETHGTPGATEHAARNQLVKKMGGRPPGR